MKGKRILLGLGVLLAAAGMLLPAKGVQAAEKKAGVWKAGIVSSDGKKSCSVDLDGDGSKEKVKLSTKAEAGSGFLTDASLSVNGKKALSFKETQALSATVDYVQLSGDEMYLRVRLTGANDFCESDAFYRYDAGKGRMVKMARLLDEGSTGTAAVKDVRHSEITVSYERQFSEVGTVTWQSVYMQKDGKLKLKKNSVSVKCVDRMNKDFDGYGKLFAKNQFKAIKAVKLYADTSLKKASYTAKKGDVLTLNKIKYAKGKFYVQLVRGDKKGWMRLKDTGSSPFGGVMERLAG